MPTRWAKWLERGEYEAPVIEQEELALSLPKQPTMPATMPAVDSKEYHEWIKKETLTLPAPSPLCQLLPDSFGLPCRKFILTFLNISSNGSSNNTSRELCQLTGQPTDRFGKDPRKAGDLQSNLFMSGLNNWLYLQLFVWQSRSCQVNT